MTNKNEVNVFCLFCRDKNGTFVSYCFSIFLVFLVFCLYIMLFDCVIFMDFACILWFLILWLMNYVSMCVFCTILLFKKKSWFFYWPVCAEVWRTLEEMGEGKHNQKTPQDFSFKKVCISDSLSFLLFRLSLLSLHEADSLSCIWPPSHLKKHDTYPSLLHYPSIVTFYDL